VGDADGAVVVTTPQELSVADVRRSIAFCRQVGMSVIGVIENMSGCVCPNCGEHFDIFKSGGGVRLSMEELVPFLGAVPLDPEIVCASDDGRPFVTQLEGSPSAAAFSAIVDALLQAGGEKAKASPSAEAVSS
jgi:MinD superfamily P-loop ATPase